MPRDISYPIEITSEQLVCVRLVGEASATDPHIWGLLTREEYQTITERNADDNRAVSQSVLAGEPLPHVSFSGNREAFIRVAAGSYVVYVFYAPEGTSLEVETVSG